ncbi:MAG: phage terminase large subunit family protein, partial [Rhodoferax sp.]|nr:phage terminase large subunit family protein [Rhodoferax sp.]
MGRGQSQANRGPYSTSVRPYVREPLECWKDSGVVEMTLCWGSQTSKTTTLMAGLAWLIDTEPSPALWLMPTESLARSFSKSRWMPMLEDCPAMVAHFPEDKDKLTHLEQHFDRSTLTFVGSNSPANLACRPVRVLVADEVDKFAPATEREADALDLAEQRLKAFSSSKLFLT